MPSKSRIDEEAFQKALRSLLINELAILDNVKSSADLWGRLCISMSKADNMENRRACYDLWKRKRGKLQDIISSMTKDGNRFIDTTTIQSNILRTEKARDTETITGDDTTQAVFSESVADTTAQSDNEIQAISHPSFKATTEQNQQLLEQINTLLSQQQRNISLICTHDLNSTYCSGDIVAIQVLCKCTGSSDCTNTIRENSSNTHLLHAINSPNIKNEKRSSYDAHDRQLEVERYDYQDCQNEEILTPQRLLNDDTNAPANTPLHLLMSPTSSLSIIDSPERANSSVVPRETSKSNPTPSSFTQTKDISSPVNISDHTIINDAQKKVLTYLQRQTEDSSMFIRNVEEVQQVERTKAVVLSQADIEMFKKLRKENFKKNRKKNKSRDSEDDSDFNSRRNRNLEWTVILDSYVKHSNDYCVFIYDRHHFTSRSNIGSTHQFLMSADAHCKFNTCSCRFHAVLNENGELKIDYFGNIAHEIGEIHARPMRGSRRVELQQFTTLGATPAALHLQQLKSMSEDNKKAGNRNTVGSSPSVIRKISSEANGKLRRDDQIDKSLRELKTEQAKKIFPGEQIPGYLQEISMDPLRLICFTAGGVAAYHQFALNMPLSWDATGGIVINRNKRIFYYELTMSNLSKGGPCLPITVMLSDSHGTMDIVHWMNCFIEKYKQSYGFSNPFPKPPVIHSDRALVFLLAGIQIFNNDETMDRYIERCWRIIQRAASKRDLEITVVHACLGHFMKNVKKNASKDLSKKQVPFGMWLMALLVNSNTLDEMIIVWRNICIVLISPNQNDQFKMSLSLLSRMADEMNANPDKTNFVLKNVLVTPKGLFTSSLETDIDEDDVNGLVLGEEEAVLYLESSFKQLFSTIFQQSKESLKVYDAAQWEHLPSNQLFSATYLARLLKLYMPTAPIWSNLLLGNFTQRYGYKSDPIMLPCSCHYGRTTGTSESQMRVLKEAILHNKIYTRIDEVVSTLGEVIEAVEIQFADYVSIKKTKNRVLPVKKQKPAQEPWNKRRKSAGTTGLYTSEKPAMNLVAMVNSRLLGQDDDVNLDIGQLPQCLRFENKSQNCWLNSMLQMMLASGNIVEAVARVGSIKSDSVSSIAVIVGGLLHTLVNKHKQYSERRKTIVEHNDIQEHIGYLRWAGINIRPGRNFCVFDFFQSGITPTLEFYDIDFKSIIEVSLECSSCEKVSTIERQTWSYLLVNKASIKDNLENVMAELFGPTLEKRLCPECFSNERHRSSLSLMNCPKNLFFRFHPTTTTGHEKHKLSTHIDLIKILSNNMLSTRSYSRYTLQSFITHNGTDDHGHYVTFARQRSDWYRLDDMNVTVMKSSSLFDDQAERQPVVFAHFIRPSNIDIFSMVLWNVFTNFRRCDLTLPPTLSLNDAVVYFAKRKIIEGNPLNLAVVKRFDCPSCAKETYIVDRLHEVWEMKRNVEYITTAMTNFLFHEINCSSCRKPGLTNSIVYDIPQFLVLKAMSNDSDCIGLIDDVELLFIRPSLLHPSFEYNVQTVLIVLEEDDIVYLRKTGNGYSSYNNAIGQFELLNDLTIQQRGLASKWTIFIYETSAAVFEIPSLEKIPIDQNGFPSSVEPEAWIIDTVNGLLPTFKTPFDVGPIEMKPNDMKILLDNEGNLNDLIIDAHLYITAIDGNPDHKILSVPSYLATQIIDKQLRKMPQAWLEHDLILCPINQKHHWYIVIIDIKRQLVVELDSLRSYDLPRAQNITRLLQVLNMQHYFKTGMDIDFYGNWKIATLDINPDLQQSDFHSCGVHMLIQAQSYVHKHMFACIESDKIQLYRHKIAEEILRKAEPGPASDDSYSVLLEEVSRLPGSRAGRQKHSKDNKKIRK